MTHNTESLSLARAEKTFGHFLSLGKQAMEGYLKRSTPTIDALDLTTHTEIITPDENFRIINSGIHPRQLILKGLHGIGTKKEIVRNKLSSSI